MHSGYPGKGAGQPPMQRPWHEKKFRVQAKCKSGKVSINLFLGGTRHKPQLSKKYISEEVYQKKYILEEVYRHFVAAGDLVGSSYPCQRPLESYLASSVMSFDRCRPERRHGGQSALRGPGDLGLTLFLGIRVFSDSWICGFFGMLVFQELGLSRFFEMSVFSDLGLSGFRPIWFFLIFGISGWVGCVAFLDLVVSGFSKRGFCSSCRFSWF